MLSKLRPFVYNTLIKFTSALYKEVLEQLPPGSRLLDIGIGTGEALAVNARLITGKALHITGVDPDHDYVQACRARIAAAGLEEWVDVRQASIADFSAEERFDAVYFSNSFMLIPKDKHADALLRARRFLKPDDHARIYFGQTHEHTRSLLLEWIKPKLKRLLTIDFGTVTYEAEFRKLLEDAGLRIAGQQVIARRKKREVVLITARP
jgi:ubiquinone/menaquinone biosynthesis C-methylase UbiE